MKKKRLVLIGIFLVLIISIAIAIDLTSIIIAEPEKETEPTDPKTISLIEADLRAKIEAVPEVLNYYSEEKELETPTKTMVEEFKGTDVVFIHTYYPNGTHAVTISTKNAIELKPSLSVIK